MRRNRNSLEGRNHNKCQKLHTYLVKKKQILSVQLCFRRFFSEIRGFIVKNWLYIYDSKYCPYWPLLSPILRVAYESRVEKTGHLLRLSTNRSNFLLLHKTGSADQPGRVP